MNSYIDVDSEVTQALAKGTPVVALESSLISHGFPWPDNRQTALDIQQAVRDEGGVPATIAIINGRIKVGINESEVSLLAKPDTDVRKCSRRDLTAVIAQKLHATTTVASTMIIAHWAGLPVFATGGIGGVHRGAQQTFDISADLDELTRTPVAVVCSGAKLILDLPLTVEYLETKGVPIIGYNSDNLAAFFCRDSGLPVDYRCNTPVDVAQLIITHQQLGLQNGLVISNPIPEMDAIDKVMIEDCIDQALNDAKKQGISGKDTTPYLLQKIRTLTNNQTLHSNISLIKNNARLATNIARELL